jgi:D-glycero-D-manno-heptose 1,7-bisphosphate phosphatase
LFLDRDGVIIEDRGYVHDAHDVHLIRGSAKAIAKVNRIGIPVIVITNQSGIARGLYDWESFKAVQTTMMSALARDGAHIDLVLACAYHDHGIGPLCKANHPWRKPNPGMLLSAAERAKLNVYECLIVGDKVADMQAGQRAGLSNGVLVRTGQGRSEVARLVDLPTDFSARVCASLADAVPHILAHFSAR